MAKPGLHLVVKCIICGKEYRQSRSDQIYCSGACGLRAWRKKHATKVIISCKNCGKMFTRISSSHKYCSEECRYSANKERKRNGRGSGWAKGIEYVDRQICIVCGKRFYAPPAQISRSRMGGQFCSQKCYGYYVGTHPERFPMTVTKRGIGGKRKDLGIYVRSTWEANYARYLNWLIGIGEIKKWEYEVDTFEFHKIKKGTRFYTPDFKITNKDGSIEYHEVKGYMDKRSQTKLNRMKKYYPDIKIVLIDKEVYYAIKKDVSGLVENWERR